MRLPRRALAVSVLVALAATACVDAPSREPRPLPEPDVYVALGDSFASGEGVQPYLAGSGDAGDACHRSRSAYATAVAEATGLTLRFRACSGATIADMFRTQRTPGGGNAVGPQLAPGVLGPDVALVTLSIGGNDLGFGPVLRHCVMHFDCFDDGFEEGLAHWASLVHGVRWSLPSPPSPAPVPTPSVTTTHLSARPT